MIASIPQSMEERRQKAEYIRLVLNENRLGNVWLIKELEAEGFTIAPQTVSSALSLSLISPKTSEFLMRAERICRRYEQNYLCRQQSEA